MKKVITYGTFDLLHDGHLKLLERAKKLGDYLIVGVTTENYDKERGKLNVHQDVMQRVENVKKTGLADKILIEEYDGQKINDISKYEVDIFAIGSDWLGKFDYLKEYCDVIYLERTKNISSTQKRNESTGILNIGVVGYGRISKRFIAESKFVSGINVSGVFGLNDKKLKEFCKKEELSFYTIDFSVFLNKIDAVYIASPHLSHYSYILKSLENNKHVLCEKPLVLRENQAKELYALAKKKNLILLEAIKTAYCPGFTRLVSMAKSGIIGKIVNVDATFTKLVRGNVRELDNTQAGGSITELSSYTLLAIIKLLGVNYTNITFDSFVDSNLNIDLFTKINISYKNAFATANMGLGVKSEGDLIISGTKGYIYVPAPWWKTDYFELRFEDPNDTRRVFHKFAGDGLRYELTEFLKLIFNKSKTNTYLKPSESIAIIKIIEKFRNKEILNKIGKLK